MDIRNVTRVGCKRDARKALAGELPLARRAGETGPRPSSGAYRMVYAAGDVVYKVCHDPSWDVANRNEAASVADVRKSPTGEMYVIPTTLWEINGVAIVAQPRMDVTYTDARQAAVTAGDWDLVHDLDLASDEIIDAADALCIRDMHGSNWMLDTTGRPWIVDANL